jgi:hypothetical protein
MFWTLEAEKRKKKKEKRKKKKEKRKSLTEDTFGVSQEKTKRPIDGESVHSLTTRKHAF